MNDMWAKRKDSGFTIVELLIVIVIIGILAAIVIVAYSGITARANDNKRAADLASIQKALELYYIDHGGYPTCSSSPGTNTSPYTLTANTVDYCLKDDLVPTYMGSLPTDPKNTGSYVYRYAAGYLKDGPVHYTGTPASDNYILGTKQDTVTSPVYSGWGAAYSDLTLLLGSSR